ncbi:hypothetical protein CapIbe_012806 [Capra ibex]
MGAGTRLFHCCWVGGHHPSPRLSSSGNERASRPLPRLRPAICSDSINTTVPPAHPHTGWQMTAKPPPQPVSWLPPSAHPAASHLVPRSQACSRPSWEAEQPPMLSPRLMLAPTLSDCIQRSATVREVTCSLHSSVPSR